MKLASDDQAFSKQMYSFLRDCIGLQIKEIGDRDLRLRSKSTAHRFYHCLEACAFFFALWSNGASSLEFAAVNPLTFALK
jgi:hypothetical protein